MSFLKTKSILVMALFLSLLTYGSHLPESGGMMNKKNLISEVDPGGISDFVVDSFFDDETGYPAFVLAIPRAVAVVGFDPNNQSDVTIINGTFHEYQEVDFGDDVIYHFIAVEGVSPGAIGESYDITLTVNENAFTIGGIGNQVSSQVFTVTGTTPTPVNTPPTVSLTSPSNGSEFTVGDNVAITAIASDSDGIESVSFVVGNNVEFTDTTAPYSFNWIATLLEEELSTVRVIAIR